MVKLKKAQSDVLCQLSDGLATVTQAVKVLDKDGICIEMISYKSQSLVAWLLQDGARALFSDGSTNDGNYTYRLTQ